MSWRAAWPLLAALGLGASVIEVAFADGTALSRSSRELALPSAASRAFVREEVAPLVPPISGGAGEIRRGSVLAFDALDSDGGASHPSTARSKNLRAIGLSLLLPGLAQYQAGDRSRGLLHMVAEGALWTAWASYRIQGNVREDSYVELARIHAGVQGDDHDDDYWKQIGSFPSSDTFDEVIRREARILYDDDLDARAAYLEANRIPEKDQWAWESFAVMDRYQEKRSDAQTSYKRSRDMIGLAVVNRVVAMIDAVLATKGPAGLHLEAEPTSDGGRLQIRRDLP